MVNGKQREQREPSVELARLGFSPFTLYSAEGAI